MRIQTTVLALTGVLALAGQASAQALQQTLYVNGPSPDNRFNAWTHEFKPGAPLDVKASFANTSSQDVTLSFYDPSDEADFYIADASGSYVSYFSASTGSGRAQECVAAGKSLDLATTWNQTDWYGQQLPDGIYSIEAWVNDSSGDYFPKTFFMLNVVTSDPSYFALAIQAAGTTIQAGQALPASLVVTNLTSQAQVLRFGGPFLPEKMSYEVRDASGNVVWHMFMYIPMIFTGPSDVYIAGLDSLTLSPPDFQGQDQNQKPLPDGQYTLVMTLTELSFTSVQTLAVTIATPRPAKPLDCTMLLDPPSVSLSTLGAQGTVDVKVKCHVFATGAPFTVGYGAYNLEGVVSDASGAQVYDYAKGKMWPMWFRRASIDSTGQDFVITLTMDPATLSPGTYTVHATSMIGGSDLDHAAQDLALDVQP